MPPAGFDVEVPVAQEFKEYGPRILTREEWERQHNHRETLRIFQNTLHEIRSLADRISERFRQATEQTARIRAEHERLKQEMERTHRKIRMKARQRAIKQREQNNRVLKAFFACKKRRQKFPDLTRKYFKSIS